MELWKGHNGAAEGETSKGRKVAPRRQRRVTTQNRIFTVTDPMHKNTVKPTSAGDIVPNPKNGYYTVESPTLASEIKQRYPWMLVTEHERFDGDPTRPLTFGGIGRGKKTDEEMEADGWVKEGTRWVKKVE